MMPQVVYIVLLGATPKFEFYIFMLHVDVVHHVCLIFCFLCMDEHRFDLFESCYNDMIIHCSCNVVSLYVAVFLFSHFFIMAKVVHVTYGNQRRLVDTQHDIHSMRHTV